MLLYDSQISGNCYKVRLLFAHLELAYERREVDVVHRTGRPELLGDLNPGLRVPTIVLNDGRTLGESGAILWLFADGTPYLPTDAFQRAQVLSVDVLRAVQPRARHRSPPFLDPIRTRKPSAAEMEAS